MALLAAAAKPAILLALAGVALGAIWALRAASRSRAEDLLPRIDVAAWNAALEAP